MRCFHFSLQPVVVLRAHGELRAREAFGAAMLGLVRAQDQLKTTRSRVARFATDLAAGRQATFSAAAEAQSLAAYQRECALEAEAERALDTAQTAMLQRRVEYIEAHRRLDIVHRLEAKARAAHRIEANRSEQAEFDDRAGRRVAARNGSPL